MSGLERRFEPRRLELVNGAGGRRIWSADAKAAVLDETLWPGAVVSVVARRHGLTPQQLFGWRREARRALEAGQVPVATGFATRVASG
uniref:transposase n=1 Tax=Methylobacterium sp. NEAU 140 TaxID=3064945 RepID=UPI0035226345